MKPRILDILNRWRHTLGYGVHSPLAFRIITECIHPDGRYAYYADSLIQSLSDNAEIHQQLRLIIRLINILHIKSIWIPECSKKMRRIIMDAYPKIRLSSGNICPENSDFIVIFDKVKVHIAPATGDSALLHLHPQSDSKMDVGNPSLTLEGNSFTLYLWRNGMQAVAYEIL